MLEPVAEMSIHIWAVTRHQYGISVLVAQTSFRGEPSGDDEKCWLFSQSFVLLM